MREAYKPMKRWQSVLMIVATLGVATTIALYKQALSLSPDSASSDLMANTEQPTPKVTALGRLEPDGGVIDVAPNILGTSSILVNELHVQLGDRVEAGDLIAVLGNHTTRQAMVVEAQQQVDTAAARLAQVQAGAKIGDIRAQEAAIARLNAQQQGDVSVQHARIARLTAEWQNAVEENQRSQELYDEGAISISELEARQTSLAITQEQVREAETVLAQLQTAGTQEIRQAEANLERIQEIRPVDIALAEEELQTAFASLQRAQVELEQTYVRAPVSGQILEVYVQLGETVSDRGIVALGQTDQMYAIAEVYETDIDRVQVGQTAIVKSEYGGFEGILHGIVEDIGLRVRRNRMSESAPGSPVDTRVIEVRVKLDPEDSARVTTLTDLQVRMSINSVHRSSQTIF